MFYYRRAKARQETITKQRQLQNTTGHIRTYRLFSDFQKSVLESEFLKNQNPSSDDRLNIAERIGVDRKRVTVKCLKLYTSDF